MHTPDVITLRQFYATPLGEQMRSLLHAGLHELWPQAKNETMLGIGYSTPYLESYRQEAADIMVCMPGQQGAAYWPSSGTNLVFLAHESELPCPDSSINRILLLHCVEHSNALSGLFDEMYRVLTPGGRILAIVPNRLGLWARSSRSPLGYGRPFSMTQLRELMTDHQFTITCSTSALFLPPVHTRLAWRFARTIERLGRMLCPFIGGVLMVEAEKQLYASVMQPVRVRKLSVGVPIPQPAMGMEEPAASAGMVRTLQES